jgi:uncharacterized protein
MEEILASIRKIISEDQSDAAPAPAASSRPAPVTANVTPMQRDEEPDEADVLELTHEVRDETRPPARHEPEPAMAAGAGSEVPAEDDVMFETVQETQEEKPAMASDDLISDNTRRAMNKAFEPLDQRAETQAPAMPTVEGVHVEAVFTRAIHQAFDPVLQEWVAKHGDDIVARMKPIIREWMDENLPELIENAVKAEISAAVRARSKRR